MTPSHSLESGLQNGKNRRSTRKDTVPPPWMACRQKAFPPRDLQRSERNLLGGHRLRTREVDHLSVLIPLVDRRNYPSSSRDPFLRAVRRGNHGSCSNRKFSEDESAHHDRFQEERRRKSYLDSVCWSIARGMLASRGHQGGGRCNGTLSRQRRSSSFLPN